MKVFSSPICTILGHDYQTSLPKITKMSYLGSTISLEIGVIVDKESHSLLLQVESCLSIYSRRYMLLKVSSSSSP